MVAVEPSLRRVDLAFNDPNAAIRRRNDVAHPFAGTVGNLRTKNSRGDRLLPCPDPHPMTEPGSPGSEHVPSGARHRTDITCPRFATQDPDAGREIRMVRQVEPLLRPEIDHAVVAAHDQRSEEHTS